MLRVLAVVTAFVVVIASGIAHGLWTNRWSESEELRRAAARVSGVPMKIGDWEGVDQEIADEQRARGELVGYCMRQYVNRSRLTNNEVQLLIVCGKPGPIANHTPEVCYGAVGFRQVGGLDPYTVDPGGGGQPAEFTSGLFQRMEAGAMAHLRILWSFSVDGQWVAPGSPRWVFGHHHFLYKVYVIRPLKQRDEPLDTDACVEFIRLLLPELQKSLFAPAPDA